MLTSEKRGLRRRRMARTSPARSRRATAASHGFPPGPAEAALHFRQAQLGPPLFARAIARAARPRDQHAEHRPGGERQVDAAADRPGHGIGPGEPDLLAFGGLRRGRAAIAGLPGAAAGLNVDLDEGVRRPAGNDGLRPPAPTAGPATALSRRPAPARASASSSMPAVPPACVSFHAVLSGPQGRQERTSHLWRGGAFSLDIEGEKRTRIQRSVYSLECPLWRAAVRNTLTEVKRMPGHRAGFLLVLSGLYSSVGRSPVTDS